MKLTLLTTGGTIDKTYNEHKGVLANFNTVLDRILASLRLPDLIIEHVEVMNKDSLDMTEPDRLRLLHAVQSAQADTHGILITHGTDTLADSGEFLVQHLKSARVPIVFTGAMRPYEFRDSDAVQNVTEALLAVRLLRPGVYVAMHNRVLEFPGVIKNRSQLCFERKSE